MDKRDRWLALMDGMDGREGGIAWINGMDGWMKWSDALDEWDG